MVPDFLFPKSRFFHVNTTAPLGRSLELSFNPRYFLRSLLSEYQNDGWLDLGQLNSLLVSCFPPFATVQHCLTDIFPNEVEGRVQFQLRLSGKIDRDISYKIQVLLFTLRGSFPQV